MVEQVSWHRLNEILNEMSEKDVADMLNAERSGARRSTVLVRLHQRFTALRAKREREEMMAEDRPRGSRRSGSAS